MAITKPLFLTLLTSCLSVVLPNTLTKYLVSKDFRWHIKGLISKGCQDQSSTRGRVVTYHENLQANCGVLHGDDDDSRFTRSTDVLQKTPSTYGLSGLRLRKTGLAKLDWNTLSKFIFFIVGTGNRGKSTH